ncbi:hypothetical protein GCM10010269_64480 [Streptomyces humidus]|uniref:ABC transporter ATP-binding protein n=1 Tax=Streptomyces humidus TaxID=52259 RepID=A0A918G345_9ACTN|nr:hypothetical protein GCM10010269_64480 [Streptomyces humidus]
MREFGTLKALGSSRRVTRQVVGESTGNLDEGTRDAIMGLLEGPWHEYGLPFVMVTHDSSIARRAPRLAIIEAGRITLTEQAFARSR